MANILTNPTLLTVTEQNAAAYEVHKFSAFASDLGIRLGHVPQRIATTLGNSQPFVLTEVTHDGQAFQYKQSMGCIHLTIWND